MPVKAKEKNVDPILSAREEMDKFMRAEGAGVIHKRIFDPLSGTWKLT